MLLNYYFIPFLNIKYLCICFFFSYSYNIMYMWVMLSVFVYMYVCFCINVCMFFYFVYIVCTCMCFIFCWIFIISITQKIKIIKMKHQLYISTFLQHQSAPLFSYVSNKVNTTSNNKDPSQLAGQVIATLQHSTPSTFAIIDAVFFSFFIM